MGMKTIPMFALAAVAAAAADVTPLWMRQGVLPEARFEKAPQTACKWLWNAERPVGDGGETYLRRTFTLDGQVRSAALTLNVDDSGEQYLNGHSVRRDGRDLAARAVQGTNVLAVHVRNATGPGGCIFSAVFTLADGRAVRIVSDRQCLGAADAPKGWETPGFDDAAWKPALEQGDAMLQPWSQLHDYLGWYGTAEERAAIEAVRMRRLPIPETLAAEPEPVCSIVYVGGTPYIRINGRDYAPHLNLAGVKTPFGLTVNLKTHALAFPFHELQFDDGDIEKAAGEYDFTMVDVEACRLLHHIPDAWLFLRFRSSLPKWCAAHRSECIDYGAGRPGTKRGDELSGRPVRASAASKAFRAELSRFCDRLGEFVRGRPWVKRIVAVRPCWGVYTEWHTYGMYESPDTGPAMTAAFHRFAGGKYAGQPPPTPAERKKGGYLLDPVKDAKTLDYFRCMSGETADLMIGMMRDVKRNFPGRLAGCYAGYVFTAFPPEGQNCFYERMLAAPELDFCSNPVSYDHDVRRPGGSYMQRAVPDAFRRHGKLLFLEDDMRFHHVREWAGRQYAPETPVEAAAVMRRNWLVKFIDGSGIQLCDPFNGNWKRLNTFDDPVILGAVADAERAIAKAGPLPAESGNDVLIVADVAQRFRWDGGYAGRKILRNVSASLPQHVQTSGAAVDIATLADYLAFDYPHRLVYVMDAYGLSDADRARLERRTARNGVKTFRFAVPGAPSSEPAAAQELSLPGSAEEWRGIFRAHGAHIYARDGSLLRRRGDLIVYSTARMGRHEITLKPKDSGATELFTGRRFDGRSLVFDADRPQTYLFKVTAGKGAE